MKARQGYLGAPRLCLVPLGAAARSVPASPARLWKHLPGFGVPEPAPAACPAVCVRGAALAPGLLLPRRPCARPGRGLRDAVGSSSGSYRNASQSRALERHQCTLGLSWNSCSSQQQKSGPCRLEKGSAGEEPNLVAFCNGVATSGDEERAVDVVCLDFCEAFDTVPTAPFSLNGRDKRFDGWTVRWVSSWLEGHSQRVVVDVQMDAGGKWCSSAVRTGTGAV